MVQERSVGFASLGPRHVRQDRFDNRLRNPLRHGLHRFRHFPFLCYINCLGPIIPDDRWRTFFFGDGFIIPRRPHGKRGLQRGRRHHDLVTGDNHLGIAEHPVPQPITGTMLLDNSPWWNVKSFNSFNCHVPVRVKKLALGTDGLYAFASQQGHEALPHQFQTVQPGYEGLDIPSACRQLTQTEGVGQAGQETWFGGRLSYLTQEHATALQRRFQSIEGREQVGDH